MLLVAQLSTWPWSEGAAGLPLPAQPFSSAWLAASVLYCIPHHLLGSGGQAGLPREGPPLHPWLHGTSYAFSAFAF